MNLYFILKNRKTLIVYVNVFTSYFYRKFEPTVDRVQKKKKKIRRK